jgi:hypothetical protein
MRTYQKDGPKRRRRTRKDGQHVSRTGWVSPKKNWGDSRMNPIRFPLPEDA